MMVPRDISRVLDRPLRERPDAIAVDARSGTMTYRQLDMVATRAAGALWKSGVRPGDRLAVSLPNDLDVVVAFHAAMRIGAVWVGIGSALTHLEKLALIQHSAPQLMLASTVPGSELGSETEEEHRLPRVIVIDPERGDDEWSSLLAEGYALPGLHLDPHAPAGIAYTSGTTGSPKGVVHSQHNLLTPGAVLVSDRGYGPDLRKGDCLPLTLINLMALTTLLTAQAGGCCVVMDRRDAVGVAQSIRRKAVNVWNGVPTQLRDLVRHPGVDASDLSTLREVWAGGADCPDALRDAFAQKFGHAIRRTYGLTEVPTIVAIDPLGDDSRSASSGRILPHLTVQAVDEKGAALPVGTVGELCVSARTSGPWANCWTPMLGYWGDGDAATMQSPLRTGDLGTVTEDGWVRVVDRRKLMIVRGGANVYPAEVERVLLGTPGVAGAAVFGVPDDRLGERVAALIEPEHAVTEPLRSVTMSALRDHCSTRLARYKIPEIWGVVDALPRNAMGKIVRRDLSDLLSAAIQPGV